jgi:hypothetical protein
VRKANKIVGCVWGIGERKWGGDFRRKMMMFDSMVEIWGWKEQEAVLQENYLQGVDRETPGYIVRKECKRNRPRVKAGNRTAKFEDKMDRKEDCRMLTECWREKKKNTEKKKSEKYVLPEKRVCQWRKKWKDWEQKENGWMKLSERNKDTDRQVRKKGVNQRIQIQQGVWQEIPKYSGVKKRREKTGIGWKERKEGGGCAMRREREM